MVVINAETPHVIFLFSKYDGRCPRAWWGFHNAFGQHLVHFFLNDLALRQIHDIVSGEWEQHHQCLCGALQVKSGRVVDCWCQICRGRMPKGGIGRLIAQVWGLGRSRGVMPCRGIWHPVGDKEDLSTRWLQMWWRDHLIRIAVWWLRFLEVALASRSWNW